LLKQHTRLEEIPILQFFPTMTHMVSCILFKESRRILFLLFENNIVNFDKRHFEMGMTQNIFKYLSFSKF
jgi:hypothetical protein